MFSSPSFENSLLNAWMLIDHDLDGAGQREVAHRAHVLGVVHKNIERRVVIKLVEVRLGALEGLDHALADGNGGHHDNKLGKAIAAVELVYRADVDVGLAGARFHLNGEVAQTAISSHLRTGKTIILLNLMEVISKLSCRDANAISMTNREGSLLTRINITGEFTREELLSLEQTDNRIDSLKLVRFDPLRI